MHTKTESQDISKLFDLLSTVLETTKIAEVLSYSPNSLLGINVLVIPINQLMSSFQILGDWFLREHMLAGRQSLLDEVGLSKNRQSDDYSLDV